MKRHVSIFAFLLGAFAAAGLMPDASAESQTIWGGYYYFDGSEQGKDAKYMSAPNGQNTIIIFDGNQTTFTAHPDQGMKVANWKKWPGVYSQVTSWPLPAKTDNTYTLTGNSAEGGACLAVNFTYIPLIVETNRHDFVTGDIRTKMTLPVLLQEGYTGKWKNEKGKTFEFGKEVSGKDFWYDADWAFHANLTADWTANTYTIVFNGNGATGGSMSDLSCTYNQSKSLTKNAFVRTYYAFKGWNTKADGTGDSYSDGVSVKNLTDVNDGKVTLYAQWSLNSYTVKTQVASGSSGKGTTSPDSVTRSADTSLTITATPNDGYAFAQWDDGSTEATRTVTVVSNATYEATFTNRVYTMNFYLNQSSEETPWSSKQVIYEAPIGTLPNPVWEFHAFQGWFTARVGGDQVVENSGSGTTVYKWITDLPLYAHWTEAKGHDITVEYDSERGTVTVEGTKVGGKFVENTEVMFTATANNGYSFSHWEKGSSIFTENPLTNVVTESATYIAVFTGKVYKVDFQWWDDGTVSGWLPRQMQVTFGEPYGMADAVPDDPHYEFDYWLDADEKKITAETAVATANRHTLYAHVTLRPTYTIHYDGNDACGAMADQTAYCGVDVVLTSNNYTRTGYTFNGWTNSTGTAFADGATVRDLANTNETATLYAAWSPIHYTLAFDPQGGNFGQELKPRDCIYGQEFELQYKIGTRELFDFVGWSNAWNGAVYSAANEFRGKDAYDVPNGTNTLVAVWNSQLTDYSRAMHCTNLVWKTEETNWFCVIDSTAGYEKSGSCVQGKSKAGALSASAPANEGGTLAFWWKANKGDLYSILAVEYGTVSTNLMVKAKDVWQFAEIAIPARSTPVSIDLKLPYDNNYTVDIDLMTWTPGGPEPVDGKDNVTISSAAVSADGKSFSLSFEFNEEFDYLLKTNANLLSGNWGVMEIEGTKKGNILTFKPPILEGQPQMFYRVETIQKK